MSWSVKIKDGKYRFYSNNSNEYVSDFMTREETIRFLMMHDLTNFMNSVVKNYMSFPHYWSDKDSGKILLNSDGIEEYTRFLLDDIDKDNNDKLDEILDKLGIKIRVDINGYIVSNSSEPVNQLDDVLSLLQDDSMFEKFPDIRSYRDALLCQVQQLIEDSEK